MVKIDPVPMFLTCPGCNARHIDEGEFATKVHHTHSCQVCGLTWRPAVVPTVGVQFLPGFKSSSGGGTEEVRQLRMERDETRAERDCFKAQCAGLEIVVAEGVALLSKQRDEINALRQSAVGEVDGRAEARAYGYRKGWFEAEADVLKRQGAAEAAEGRLPLKGYVQVGDTRVEVAPENVLRVKFDVHGKVVDLQIFDAGADFVGPRAGKP